MITCTRYHDFSAGHRVYGHENKCANLHGHNYRIHFTCAANALDTVGRVIDFAAVKRTLCAWLEEEWDHKFLLYENDPLYATLLPLKLGVILVPFNPTAENMARYLVERIAPTLLHGTGVYLSRCVVEETRKCSAAYEGDVSWTKREP